MRVITLDGPSKTGKTCLGEHLQVTLQNTETNPVVFDSIGNFFRKMAGALIMRTGQEIPDVTDVAVLRELTAIIGEGVLFNPRENWGDLHGPTIENAVSSVGATATAQEAKGQWSSLATQAVHDQGAGIWIVDGRNPRRTLADELRRPDMHHVLDMLVFCAPEVSAWRSGLDVHKIVERRAKDEGGEDPIYISPKFPIPYEPVDTTSLRGLMGLDFIEKQVVASMWNSGADTPTPVLLDTTELGIRKPDKGLAMMLDAGEKLVRSALTYYPADTAAAIHQ